MNTTCTRAAQIGMLQGAGSRITIAGDCLFTCVGTKWWTQYGLRLWLGGLTTHPLLATRTGYESLAPS